MKKIDIFIDSDIILDVLLERNEFYEESANVLDLGELKKINLFTSVISITNIAYILRKELKNFVKTKEYIQNLIEIVRPLPVTEKVILDAIKTDFHDFEDSIQYITAKTNNIDTLITRNKKDYKTAGINIFTPREFLTKGKYK